MHQDIKPTALLRAFRHRNYRLYFVAQTIALNGTWMTMAALGWLLYRLTGDPLTLGLMAFFLQGPTFLLAPIGGLVVDHFSRRKVIMAAQATDGLTVGVLAFLTLTGQVTVGFVLAACVLLGVVKAFEMPARQALVADLVGTREDLSNAIALNASIFHSARLIGPVLAGALIIPWFGEGACFLLHSVSYLGSLGCYLVLRPKPKTPGRSKKTVLGRLAEGFEYSFGYPPVRDLMLLLAALALFALPHGALLPVFAESVLQGDSKTYGLLLGAGGMGALTAALLLATRRSVVGMGKVIAFSSILFGVTLLLFAFSTHLEWSLFLLFAGGFCSMNAMVGANMIIQTLVEDDLRGRVMSLMGMVFMGGLPVGSLMFGKAASLFGAPVTVAVGAIVTTFVGILFLWRLPELQRMARPVYVERGLLPEE